jgi:hypothetical protein
MLYPLGLAFSVSAGEGGFSDRTNIRKIEMPATRFLAFYTKAVVITVDHRNASSDSLRAYTA